LVLAQVSAPATTAIFQSLEENAARHAGIAAWIRFYNGGRPHQALGDCTPLAVWREGVTGALGQQRCEHDAALGQR
jgi:hypothetical protein